MRQILLRNAFWPLANRRTTESFGTAEALFAVAEGAARNRRRFDCSSMGLWDQILTHP